MATDTVTTNADSGAGSLRAVLAAAAAGDTIVFDPTLFTTTSNDIKLASSLTITKNVTIDGSSGAPPGAFGIKIDGQHAVTDLVINAGVSAYITGLSITAGKGTGAAGGAGAPGAAAAGGIFDSGTLTLNGVGFVGDTATGGNGGSGTSDTGFQYPPIGTGGQPGGAAAGGIYVASGAMLNLVNTSNAFIADNATGGNGGTGGEGYRSSAGGAGGSGGYATSDTSISGTSLNRAATAGAKGATGVDGVPGAAGGAPGQAGAAGYHYTSGQVGFGPPPPPQQSAGGGGGGGNAFATYGGLGTVRTVAVACYCRNTLILTDSGKRPVESLAIGDTVITASGERRPIKWIGHRGYAGRFASANPQVLPICLKADSLADGVPRRDLWVSPKHAMFVDGVLIAAEHLVNGSSIVRATRIDRVEYWHVELDEHDILLAEGAAAESFVDDDSRGMFHNAHTFGALYPGVRAVDACYCAPRVEQGFILEAVRRRLADRAGVAATAHAA